MGIRINQAAAAAALLMAACGAAPDGVTQDAASPEWVPIPAENLLLIDTEKGPVTVELNPAFAPEHAARMRALSASGTMDGQRFYRVIESFVAQGGLKDEAAIEDWATLENENDRPYGGERFVPLGNEDLFAPEVGHIDGFPVGRNADLEQEWLLHCPGAMAMARDTDPDSGSTEFYIVLDAQRYLDRNLTIFGRVIDGMEHVQALKRGERAIENGVIQPPEKGDLIERFRVASDLPEDERPAWEKMDTTSEAFEAFKTSLRVRDNEFFYRKPPEVLDICSFTAPVRPAGSD